MRTLGLFAGDPDGIRVQPEESFHPPDHLSEIVSLSLTRVASFQPLVLLSENRLRKITLTQR